MNEEESQTSASNKLHSDPVLIAHITHHQCVGQICVINAMKNGIQLLNKFKKNSGFVGMYKYNFVELVIFNWN